MGKNSSFYDTVDQIVTYGIDNGILHLYTGDAPIQGTTILMNSSRVLNFGSCSYLGLEFDKRIQQAASDAIYKYGSQFSESRAYVSLGLYEKLEHLLERIFDAYCVVTPTTTLGHIANIPVLVGDQDAVVMDQQVHNSVQTAVQLVKARNVTIEYIRHNRMDLLEEKIKELRQKHKKIWYMADGIYSMFGDCTPIDIIYQLLEKYPEFYFYVDDAHGMSIHGKNGRGFVLSHHNMHPKMALATSLNKAFASGGGVMVYGDKELARKVGTVGGPLLSSGPMQPSGLGAAIASAEIHLSDEINAMQQQLQDNIQFANLMLSKYQLPVISTTGSAIFFIGISLPKAGQHLVKRMLDLGFYVNLGIFPTVPMKQTGVRFTITRLHTFEEIERMISTLAKEMLIVMKEEEITLPEIYKAFKLPLPEELDLDTAVNSVIKQSLELTIVHHSSIHYFEKELWDALFEGKGTFDREGLALLEKSFSNNTLPEDNWIFDYLLVKDRNENIVAATFCTTALWKDDMLAPGAISQQVEKLRKSNPYYLTSKVTCTGSLITEGEHVYIDYASPLWKEAWQLLFQKIYQLQDQHNSNSILIRDFQHISNELDNLMVDNGFFKIEMPGSNVLSLKWNNAEDYLQSLSANSKKHFRKNVLNNSAKFKVEVIEISDWEEEIEYWYQLYLNVKKKSLELNTFALPFQFFKHLAAHDNWEMLQLTINTPEIEPGDKPCCVVFSYKTKDAYVPMIIGIDYTYNHELNIYRQALYQVVLRALKCGKKKILFGFSADVEKKKLGTELISTYAYLHVTDSFNAESLSALSVLSRDAAT